MHTFLHTFDELPLIVMHGFTVSECSGQAEIDMEGGVHDIWVEGTRWLTKAEQRAAQITRAGDAMQRQMIPLDKASSEYETIRACLEADENGRVRDRIADEIPALHEARRADRARQQREIA